MMIFLFLKDNHEKIIRGPSSKFSSLTYCTGTHHAQTTTRDCHQGVLLWQQSNFLISKMMGPPTVSAFPVYVGLNKSRCNASIL